MIEKGCTCQACREMCLTYPCMPLPDEARKMIQAGYGDLLMLDTLNSWYEGKKKILALRPAMIGFEKGLAPMEIAKSPCVFFKNELCDLHPLNLKPYEGRACLHDTDANQELLIVGVLRKAWSTTEGQNLALEWAEKYYTGVPKWEDLLATINGG